MQFSRIRLENWRNFGEVDVAVSTRVFLVGANASGKSNFLDALRFLRELVILGGGFQKAVLDRGGVTTIRNLAARRNASIALDIDLSDGEERKWRYRLVFGQDSLRRPVLREEKVWDADDNVILDRPDKKDADDDARLGQTQLEQVFANKQFREIAGFLRSIKYLHIIPQLVREPERTAAGYKNDPFGSDFLEQVASSDKRSQKARLRRIQDVLRALVPQLAEIELWRDGGIPHLRGKYQHWRPHGAWQTEREFSDGTLRLVGLVWALQDGQGPLLLEEPELSLHPEVVLRLPQLLYRIQRSLKKSPRQTFISTHSLELLQDEGIGAHEILLLITSKEGTFVCRGASDEMIRKELEAGLTIADVVLPRTAPDTLTQLTLL
ncbi:MAG: AAA family ATPase [Anaerolineaceae bacterium]|nr:AAA family ATPase [Anaerolineaceae bacterium]MDE0328718.1 AAA family ATPase [Anaerolineaceae bacterium]